MISEKLKCFGTATTQDYCLRCPDNTECCNETIRRFMRKKENGKDKT